MEELYKHDLTKPDYYNGMVSHSEPDILECEVKWALGSTAVNKASGYNGRPAELFKTLNYDAIKVLHSICQQTWKTQQWPQNWKRSILIPIPKKCSTKECSNHCTIALIFTVKASAYNEGDLGSIPGSRRSPGEGNDNPLQYSRLEHPINGEAW